MSGAKLLQLHDGQEIILKDNFTIGRSLSNSYVIEELPISRVHCIFKKDSNNKWSIIDKSSNGTIQNNRKLKKNEPSDLFVGDILIITENIRFEFLMHNSNDSTLMVADQSEMEVINLVDSFNTTHSSSKTKKPKGRPPLNKQPTLMVPMVKEIDKNELNKPGPSQTVIDFEEELACSICTELLVKAVTLNCQHTFCSYCISLWRKNKNLCPICKTKIKEHVPTLLINNLVEKVVENLPLEERKRRETIIKQREVVEKPKPKKKARKNATSNGNRRSRRLPRDSMPIEISSDDSANFQELFSDDDIDLLEVDHYYGFEF
ncbi:PREDICTED: E3 ubiquitin-protein ligase RNF8-B-like isoform X2 [Nicrophorus vespilloides]|uniref:E3 ubiquitin-protein ligase CHFR n=1 Tax=Nicrophorus vespilloides TaxID=110193 RepID=A0ABM1N7C8_NICVS|nr:PREDICTED: E3 ubiquitin-protein ligase RNF8-B-like isoform X2 [Nicrophorus vespilloides]